MKTFQVVLSKSYLITVKAETPRKAKEICEFYTGDIHDLSADVDREKEKFNIENIECTVNETFECKELEIT